jgi:hypothetical protein
MNEEECDGTFVFGGILPQPCLHVWRQSSKSIEPFIGARTLVNVGWKFTAYENDDCTGDIVGTFLPDDGKKCKVFDDQFRSISILPLWNADYRAGPVQIVSA